MRDKSDGVERRIIRPLLRLRYRSRFPKKVLSVTPGARLLPTGIDLPSVDRLPDDLKEAAEAILAEADLIVDHRMKFVSDRFHHYGRPIDWKTDPETGYTWPNLFHEDLRLIDLSSPEDPIRVWEPSRGHQFLTLARASRLAPEHSKIYLNELASQLDDWIATNPTGYGVNWGNAMEAAIRATNWFWAIATAGTENLPPETLGRVTRSLQQHGRFIRLNLEGTRLRVGNHRIADLMGLAAIGQAVEGDPELDRAARFAAAQLTQEVTRQVNGDGGSFEGSGLYHGLVLEMLAIGVLSLDRSGIAVPEEVRGRIAEMVEFALAIRHPDGRTAQYGDSDSGRILPGGFERPPSHDAVIWTTAAILGMGRPLPGDPDPEVAWTLGVDVWQEMASRPEADPARRSSFPETGIYLLEGEESKAIVDCGSVGKEGFGGHAHNDALSFEWSLGRHPVIVDTGTVSYTGDPGARNEMRSTAAHPTPAVDREELNPIRPDWIFRLDEASPPFVTSFDESENEVSLEAGHDSYSRLADPVAVRRKMLLQRKTGVLEIVDRFEGKGRHVISMPLPLHPDVGIREVDGSTASLEVGGRTVEVSVEGATLTVEEGRYSQGYGIVNPAERLGVNWEGEIPHSILIRFEPSGC